MGFLGTEIGIESYLETIAQKHHITAPQIEKKKKTGEAKAVLG
jgi:hypothetical protein